MRWRIFFNPVTLTLLFVMVSLVGGSLAWQRVVDDQSPRPPAGEIPCDLSPEDKWKIDTIMASIAAKQAVALKLAERQLSLLAAASLIREIDRSSPYFPWLVFPDAFPGATDDERHCWEVIEWVRGVRLEKGDIDDRVDELVMELRQHRCEGTLRLPN